MANTGIAATISTERNWDSLTVYVANSLKSATLQDEDWGMYTKG